MNINWIVKVVLNDNMHPIFYGPYDFDTACNKAKEYNKFFTTEIISLIP